MEDTWYIYPVMIGEDQGWISYNHSYADIAVDDPRHGLLRIGFALKEPDEFGLPADVELSELSLLDSQIDERITGSGGAYIGRVTVAGQRFLHFQVGFDELTAEQLVNGLAEDSAYTFAHTLHHDPDKGGYWDYLYPDIDDQQVIEDLNVLSELEDSDDDPDLEREVHHWAFFSFERNARQFKDWVEAQGYALTRCDFDDQEQMYVVQYHHLCTMQLGDISHHTISANRKALEMEGRYDGWETSVAPQYLV